MSKTDETLAPRLRSAPTYQAALRGQWWAPGMPQTPGFKALNLRAAARLDGIDIPSGYAFNEGKGEFYDANADHWYSDPRIIGPIAVAATTAGFGALGGPAGLAPGASGVIPGTGIPTVAGAGGSAALPFAPASAALPAAGASGVIPGTGIPTVGGTGAGVTAPPAMTAAGITGTTAAATSSIERLRRALTSPEGIAALGSFAASQAMRGGNANAGNTDELRRIQGITEAQMRRSDPLHQVAVQLAFQRAPIRAREGVTLGNVPLP